MPGSSPLARGTRERFGAPQIVGRLIPARAGNTSLRRPFCQRRPAHPRSRGEHTKILSSCTPTTGSSPLARGTLSSRMAELVAVRLIPARAGNTRSISTPHLRPSAHPRSRGEHIAWSPAMMLSDGSSPLARGTPPSIYVTCLGDRLIPARAGNTISAERDTFMRSAHPRSRGEHPYTPDLPYSLSGSSPLARGTPR